MDIIEQIKKGEGKTLEFKEKMPSGDQIAKTLTAFSNTAGGKIVIGVNSAGKIEGIDCADKTEYQDRISNIIHDTIHPAVMPEIYSYNIDGKNILIIEVFPGPLKPYFLKSRGKSDGVFIRIGATNKKADSEYIQELERQRKNISYDEEIAPADDARDFDAASFRKLIGEMTGKKNITEREFLSLKLLKEVNGRKKLTNAALILSGAAAHSRIKCARFKGNSVSVFIDRKDLDGDIFAQLDDAVKFLKFNLNLKGEIKNDLRRKDSYEIPIEAIREALINAIVHRDYAITGSDIKISVFDDTVEILSPGSLPNAITIEEILRGRSEIRNKVLARIFKEANMIEQWGTGVRRIIKSCSDAGLRPPEFIETGIFLTVRFYRTKNGIKAKKANERANERANENFNEKSRPERIKYISERKTKVEKANERANENFNRIIGFITLNDGIGMAEAMKLTGLSRTRTFEILKRMSELKLIMATGSGRLTRYVLIK
ncbi:MAG TPA: putative DNA binding domain-containing protein [Candidatus Wallbacteria bacterium]|nr:putative DNA binding domain-containing protein [Candidatus Wallbacteria bacterium]